ncbi:MAG: PAS domain S-box protein [Nitrospira sp.]|nr:PAS domain S-box protein [Nitrospira sp.]
MSPTSHLHELDLLRRQVADLGRELAERDRVLHERTRHLQVALALAHLGSWNWDIASGEVEWSDELYRIFGYEPRSRTMTFDSFVSAVLPDDHDRVLASIDDALAGKATYDIEFRIVRQDGEIRMIHSCGEVVRDSSGQPLRMFGTALDVTDRKRGESVLKQRETYFRALIEHSSDIITVLDQGGVIQFESPSIERLLGYAQHELNGRIAFEFVHHEDLPAVTEKFRLLIERPGTPQMAEFRFRHKDGSWRSLEGIGRATSDPEGRWSVIVNSRDITERKLAEAMLRTAQEKLRQALQASGTGLWDWNTETNEAVLSEEWKYQLGYEPTEMSDSFETWTTHLHPDDHDRAVAYVRDYLSSREGDYRQEFRLRHKDGTYRWIEARASFVTEADGRSIRLLGSHTDITDRKRMEESVRESEEWYRTLVELSPSGVFVFSEGQTVYINHTGAVLLGARDAQEIFDRPTFEFIHPDYHQEVRENVRRLLNGGMSVHSAERMYLKMDGTPIPVQVEAARITWNGKPAILGLFSDITERKRGEDRVREMNLALAQAMPGIFRVDFDGRYLEVNQLYAEMLGYEPSELLGRAWEPTVHPEDLYIAQHAYKQLLEKGKAEFECRAVRKDGSIFFKQVLMVRSKPSVGGFLGHHCFMRDITERKQTEEALRASEERYARATAVAKVGVWELDALKGQYHGDANLKALFGYGLEELSTDPFVWLKLVHPDDQAIAMQNWELVQSGAADAAHYELRHIKKDGAIIWGDVRCRAVRDRDGQVTRLIGATVDITERKQTEELLRESEAMLLLAQRSARAGVWDIDLRTNTSRWSAPYYELLGVSRDVTPSYENWIAHIHPDDRARVEVEFAQAVREGGGQRIEFRILRDGEERWLHGEGHVTCNAGGKPVRISGITWDITERKAAEEALRESEERFSKAFRTSPHLIGITELETGRCIEVNDACLKVYGFCREEVIGNTTLMLGIWPDLQERTKLIDHLRSKGSVRNREVSMRMKNGDLRQFLISVDLITLKGKRCLLTIGNDITERKRVEVALRESEERYGRATAIGKVGVWEMDIEKNHYYYGDANLKAIFGYAPEELSPEPYAWLNLVSPGDRPIAMNNWERMRDGTADMCRCELRMVKKDGSIVWADVRCHSVRDQNGRLTRLIGAIVDITERKQAEEALRASEERFAKAFRASPHPVVVSELDSGRVVDANDAAYQLFGYCKEEAVGYTTLQMGLWHSAEERARFVERLKRVGSVRNMEVTLRSKSGEIRQCLLSSELIELNGKPCSVTVGDDVTESKRMERALQLTQFSVDQAVEAILWVDQTGRIFNVNETACRMLGYARQDLTTMTMHDIDPNFPVERWLEHWNYLKKQGALAFEATYWSRTGAVLEMEVTFNYLQYDGKEYGCAILRDIGERRRAEAELHRSHTFLRQVIDTDPDLIFAKDREGYFTMANKAVADWYGSTVEDLVGKSDADFNPNAEEVECFRKSDLEVIHSGRDRFIPEEKITDAGGRTRWLQTVKRPIFDDQGRVHMVLGTATDITERKRMEEILLQRERDLSAALQERERISQDLHDGILQSLYAVGLGLEACKPLIKKQQDHVAEKFMATLNQAIGQLNQVMTEVRNFIAGLESQVMQGGDFSAALRTMVETMSTSSSARCRVRIDDAAARRLSTEQALHIINIVREGLSNALRHSRAKQITVSLRDLIRSDRLAVTDDGIGFNTRSVQGVGHGLVNMAARAQKIRGLFAIQSKPDKGTRICLDLPKDTHYAHN